MGCLNFGARNSKKAITLVVFGSLGNYLGNYQLSLKSIQ